MSTNEKIIKDTEQLEYEKAVKEAKSKHRKVYQTVIADEKIVWRTLKRSEYKEIMSIGEEQELSDKELLYLREESVAKKVILYPTNIDEIIEDLAAVAEIISTECMEKSGFLDNKGTTKL